MTLQIAAIALFTVAQGFIVWKLEQARQGLHDEARRLRRTIKLYDPMKGK